MRGQDQQAYDRGSAMFSPDGRIYQVEYAHEAVSQGSTSVAVRTPEGTVLAVSKRLDPLLVGGSVEKLHKVDHHVGIATTGHVADGRKLVENAREEAQVHRLRYEEPIPVSVLTKSLTDDIQEYTQVGGTRPCGVSLLIAGVEDGEAALYEADPSGNPTSWKARAVGDGGEVAQDHLETHYEAEMSLGEGVDLAMAAMREGGEDMNTDALDVGVADVDAGEFRVLADDEVRTHIDHVTEDEADDDGGDESEE